MKPRKRAATYRHMRYDARSSLPVPFIQLAPCSAEVAQLNSSAGTRPAELCEQANRNRSAAYSQQEQPAISCHSACVLHPIPFFVSAIACSWLVRGAPTETDTSFLLLT